MTPTKPSGISAADAPIDHSRREALKRFGRYATAAPAAMVLLEPRESLAKRSLGLGLGKGKGLALGIGKGLGLGKGGGNHY